MCDNKITDRKKIESAKIRRSRIIILSKAPSRFHAEK